MEEIDIHAKLAQIETAPHFSMIFDGDTERAEMIADHLIWLHSIRRERPLVSRPFKVGIYIRYFNQTRYENYLDFHKKGFIDTLALCPKWDLVDFYMDISFHIIYADTVSSADSRRIRNILSFLIVLIYLEELFAVNIGHLLTIETCIEIQGQEAFYIFLPHSSDLKALLRDHLLYTVSHLKYLLGFLCFTSCDEQELSSSSHLYLYLIQEFDILFQYLLDLGILLLIQSHMKVCLVIIEALGRVGTGDFNIR